MEPESKYESVPYGFAYCLNEQLQALYEVPALSRFETAYAGTDCFLDRKPRLHDATSR